MTAHMTRARGKTSAPSPRAMCASGPRSWTLFDHETAAVSSLQAAIARACKTARLRTNICPDPLRLRGWRAKTQRP
eukprot:CAMPEP_0170616548 /NCGR_PEP_ID=MMETSP0224-20130122/25928_1 /TAXON_ID=285029 /ORGANISM="Togula jolla, Strain CCCM 725" /LENGTH=75 /DNA_ID=CAMNT_0010942351 /DNA_START=1095 /DNA_END=1318 /DNA_ORIENTATION=-